ncbi:MAG: hypothetical protein ABJA16_09795 [Nakamurella sp.]
MDGEPAPGTLRGAPSEEVTGAARATFELHRPDLVITSTAATVTATITE